ncbi:MAG: T9SS type A sorting domain-containing protein [Bacteroidia bacterium]
MKTLLQTLFLLLIASTSFAQDGSLDLTFDTDGRVTTAYGTFDEAALAIALQSDGKILIAGHSYNNADYDFAVVRYNSDGSLDNTFGTGGIVTTPIGSGDDRAKAIALQSDGKIVVAGSSYNGTIDVIALARYNSDGSLDNTFDVNGILTTVEGIYNEYAEGVAIQSDGKIVVTGGIYNVNNFDVRVVRYNADGSLDNTFDTDGLVRTAVTANYNDYANDVEIQSDGKIVVAGFANSGLEANFMLLRYNSDGSLDNTFDTDGIIADQIFGTFNEYGNALAIQDDGKLLITGTSNNTFYDFITLRFNTDGTLDPTFDNDGIAVIDWGTSTDYGEATAILVQPDDDIVVAGLHNINADLYFAVAKYNGDGTLDNTFDSDGKVTTGFGGSCQGMATAIQPDGKILVAGGNYSTQNTIAIARYNNSVQGVIIGVDNPEAGSEILSASPNPFAEQTIFQSQNSLSNATFILYNAAGQQVKQLNNISGNSFTLHRENLATGLYYYQLLQDNAMLAADKLIISEK